MLAMESATPTLDEELLLLDEPDEGHACTSAHCADRHRGDHPASYFVLFTCACTMFWCEQRYTEWLTDETSEPPRNMRCTICGNHTITVVTAVGL